MVTTKLFMVWCMLLTVSQVKGQCNGTVKALPPTQGEFTSPGYPNKYRRNLNCFWAFPKLAHEDYAVIIRVMDIDLFAVWRLGFIYRATCATLKIFGVTINCQRKTGFCDAYYGSRSCRGLVDSSCVEKDLSAANLVQFQTSGAWHFVGAKGFRIEFEYIDCKTETTVSEAPNDTTRETSTIPTYFTKARVNQTIEGTTVAGSTAGITVDSGLLAEGITFAVIFSLPVVCCIFIVIFLIYKRRRDDEESDESKVQTFAGTDNPTITDENTNSDNYDMIDIDDTSKGHGENGDCDDTTSAADVPKDRSVDTSAEEAYDIPADQSISLATENADADAPLYDIVTESENEGPKALFYDTITDEENVASEDNLYEIVPEGDAEGQKVVDNVLYDSFVV